MATKKKTIAEKSVQKTMHKFKHGELSKGRGGKVKNPKQAIAIGLSEARKAGANVPPNPKKKTAAKKATKKAAVKKTAAKKSPAKKAVKKTAAKKTTAKKSATKKS